MAEYKTKYCPALSCWWFSVLDMIFCEKERKRQMLLSCLPPLSVEKSSTVDPKIYNLYTLSF
ncbi:hypothetical protein YC2023_111899 [Brassica napus]